jgi:hypothetical protein
MRGSQVLIVVIHDISLPSDHVVMHASRLHFDLIFEDLSRNNNILQPSFLACCGHTVY